MMRLWYTIQGKPDDDGMGIVFLNALHNQIVESRPAWWRKFVEENTLRILLAFVVWKMVDRVAAEFFDRDRVLSVQNFSWLHFGSLPALPQNSFWKFSISELQGPISIFQMVSFTFYISLVNICHLKMEIGPSDFKVVDRLPLQAVSLILWSITGKTPYWTRPCGERVM